MNMNSNIAELMNVLS